MGGLAGKAPENRDTPNYGCRRVWTTDAASTQLFKGLLYHSSNQGLYLLVNTFPFTDRPGIA